MNIFKTLLLSLTLCSTSAYAQNSICQPVDQSVNIEIDPLPFQVSYNFNVNVMQLTDYALNHNTNHYDYNKDNQITLVRGLTHSAFLNRYNTQMATYSTISGDENTVCAYPKDIIVHLGWEPVTVFVESEYDENSCQHNAILEHENKHVKIMQAMMDKYIPIIRADLEAEVQNNFPVAVPADDKKESVQVIENLLKRDLDKMTSEKDELDGMLDSPDSIMYTQHECPTWYFPANIMPTSPQL